MRYSILALFVSAVLLPVGASARSYTFNPALIDDGAVDVSLFNEGLQLPGDYSVNITMNGETVDNAMVSFRLAGENRHQYLTPCLTPEQLSRYGVDISKYPALSTDTKCADLNAIPQATTHFDFYSQRLSIVVPPQSMLPKVTGIAPEALWDDGIPALMLNWDASTQHNEYRGPWSSRSDSDYVRLQPGLNLGAWRLRNASTWQKSSNQPGKWQSAYTYAERGINSLKSRLTLGESYTTGSVFDSVPFRGVMLASDENMVPYNQRAFAPVVRGIARTQARVEVRQNGYLMSAQTVPAGPFEITDLPSTGGSGDLLVTVLESDDSRQDITVPYNTPAIALRQGYLKYSVAGGQYRSSSDYVRHSPVMSAELMYGLPWNLTVYGGIQTAEHYQSGSAGLGAMLGAWGALSADVTHARSQWYGDDTRSGQRWRVRYNEGLESGTTLSMASEEYDSEGYSSLTETLNTWCESDHPCGYSSVYRPLKQKSRTSVSLSQSLGGAGSLSLNGSRQTYRNDSSNGTSWGAGYSTMLWGRLVASLDWSRNQNTDRQGRTSTDNLTSLFLSLPLNGWSSPNPVYASYQMNDQSHGDTNHELGMYGDTLNRRLHWNVRERYRDGAGNDKASSALYLDYRGTYGEMTGNYSYSRYQRLSGAGLKGNLLLTGNGLTLGQPQGDTLALVEAPGVSGAPVGSWPGVRTDFRGYTALGYLTPYQMNDISVDPRGLPDDAALPQTTVKVAPTKGAVVRAKFHPSVGKRVLLTLLRPAGSPVPFGAVASVAGNTSGAGIVSEGNQVYLTGVKDESSVTVRWGQGQQKQCVAELSVPEKPGPAGVYVTSAQCL
ncbi:fimbria/pilus outer membrane usher protein [Salmonella enterica]|nr:fimbria/pilus outer membrane usher protein [Salmonella enterica]EEP1393692.1 fimbria/pilus outer membrane usher protein [Salmonella enterica]EFU7974246.1 fimbria/pilus outer membrane usher protein [Salmonella enterica]EGF1421679.1 fimbria/pilus outer membrane usher protein [Salmonella enterica]ELZ8477675.1 fimbria/pilus outer membrane usher protein [Salmonella enterica]